MRDCFCSNCGYIHVTVDVVPALTDGRNCKCSNCGYIHVAKKVRPVAIEEEPRPPVV